MKRVLLMSDIHANDPALKAIEEFVRPHRFHRIVQAPQARIEPGPSHLVSGSRTASRGKILPQAGSRLDFLLSEPNVPSTCYRGNHGVIPGRKSMKPIHV